MILFKEIWWQVPSVQVYSLECFCAEVVSRKLFFFSRNSPLMLNVILVGFTSKAIILF